MGVYNFTKIKNKDGQKKKYIYIYIYISFISFQKFLTFLIWAFPENAQCFVGAFL